MMRKMKVFVVNAGSSSIKYQLYQMPEAAVLARGIVEKIGEDISKLYHSQPKRRSKTMKRQWH